MSGKQFRIHLKRLHFLSQLRKCCKCLVMLGIGIAAAGLIFWIYAMTKHGFSYGQPVLVLIAGLFGISLGSSIDCVAEFTKHRTMEKLQQFFRSQEKTKKMPTPKIDKKIADIVKLAIDETSAPSPEAV